MFAAIDIGTNTARMLLGDIVDGRIQPCLYERRITRLGGGMSREKGLTPAAMARTLDAMISFSGICRAHEISKARAVGTAAFRSAVNIADFVRQIEAVTGFEPETISGAEEAALTSRGVLAALEPIPAASLIIDVGGGSTEYALVAGDIVHWSTSRPLGVVQLTETCPNPIDRWSLLSREIDGLVKPSVLEVLESLNKTSMDLSVVGTAGTATTLAALDMQMSDYDWRRVNNYRMTIECIRRLYDQLLPLSVAEREQWPGMEAGRGDLIMAGIEIITKTLDSFKQSALVVSDFGLLEGVLLGMANEN